jgi:P4 family phage/plasmid primase-like protien
VCTEYDIATVLHRYYNDLYVCVSIQSHKWYQFRDGRWVTTDSGTALRKQLQSSESIMGLYMTHRRKMSMLVSDCNTPDVDQKKYQTCEKNIDTIVNMLKRRADVIMHEAAHLFYEEKFIDKLDSYNHLLCFTNGIMDFQTNEFRIGKPDDLAHKCTNTAYLPIENASLAVQDEIHEFMKQLFPDEPLRKYMWEHAASVLIGLNSNQTFNIYTGVGRNGKSKFVELMTSILGDYKGLVPVSLITSTRGRIGSVSPELAVLKGVRYAVMQESSLNDRINEGVMKELTGGDVIQGRGLYSDPISFIPQFKLVMSTNNLPGIDGKDDGTWRRIRTVEFKSKFVNRLSTPHSKYEFIADKNLDRKFHVWKPVFMSMLVDIAKRTHGNVVDCDMVTEPSEKYRMSQDYLASFVDACVEKNPNGMIKDRDLIARFKEWWQDFYSKRPPMGKELFDYMAKTFGTDQDVRRKKTVWIGLSIANEPDDVPDEQVT